MNSYPISIRPFGIHAILLEWPGRVDVAILEDILQFTQYLKECCLKEEEWEIVPAYNSVTLIYREEPIDFDQLKVKLLNWYKEDIKVVKREKILWRLPVCYDEDFGIDLKEISQKSGKTVDEIVSLHTSNVYTVFGIGFLPGFTYLGGVPEVLQFDRREEPRSKVLSGSVGLAGKQTGIYPQDSPGGWNIIGNCSVPMFDPKAKEPCFISVGDQVQFYKITRAEYNLHKIESEVGIYKLEKIILDA
ncbi:5-oxoprolinase subunit PxpB [Zobellia barbeyronii]|uniref:5-oxoprolinase subunit PxpB n=1 Tax=Zobellia barbeyronii TaxID=2748009 RepID=A0ABS5WI27_9FLAO|nr:5-oxoprolinase subunit PxpB [Zobellia barbeyronii]MBT2163035.1 5-oxoprolinase subunit PxpB [Zobellia barbeyronii]